MTSPTKPTRVVIYLRVSTDMQADRGVSLDVQKERCIAYAKLYDLTVVCILIDAGASAKTLDREGLQQALTLLRRGEADALLVAKLDRLTRSVRDLGELLDTYFCDGKYSLLAVNDQIDTRSASGRLVLNILAGVSQWERETIGERTAAAMEHMARCHEYTGGRVPYGWALGPTEAVGRRPDGKPRIVRHLLPVPGEQAALGVARGMRSVGMSLRDVAARLEDRGFLDRKGRRFNPVQIARMLSGGTEAEPDPGPAEEV